MGEICAIRMFGPSHCFQRSQFASSSIRVRHLLQSLATASLVGPGSSMRRGKAPPSASMSKDRRGTCAWRVTPGYTTFTAPLHGKFLRPTGGRQRQAKIRWMTRCRNGPRDKLGGACTLQLQHNKDSRVAIKWRVAAPRPHWPQHEASVVAASLLTST
jgi:hypothetical protein